MGTDGPFRSERGECFFSLTSDYGDTVCIFHREVVLSQPNHVSKAITRHTERTKMARGRRARRRTPLKVNAFSLGTWSDHGNVEHDGKKIEGESAFHRKELEIDDG